MRRNESLEAFLYRAITSNAQVEQFGAEGRLRDPGPGNNGPAERAVLENFDVDARIQAKRMGDVYELLYCLENSVRELIEATLREAFGPEDWWATGVPASLRKAAEKRKDDDLRARWHGPRGESLLNYIDFPQYADIIVEQWDLFADLLGDRDWVLNYFSEMNRSRRALAHTGRLTEADVERMELRIRDWLRSVG